jgi:hypothetical protein
MKSLILALLLLTCLIPVVVPVHGETEDIRITISFSPQTEHMQLRDDMSYIFTVSVRNKNTPLEEGDVIDPDRPHYLFSGDVIVEVVQTLRLVGGYTLGETIVEYNNTLDASIDLLDEALPDEGKSFNDYFAFESEVSYDSVTVDLDEWITLTLDVYVNLEEYRIVSGARKYYVGERIGEAHEVYYIVGGEKEGYVRTVMNVLEEEIQKVTSTRTMVEAAVGDELGLDLSVYEGIFDAMKANVDAGDYVSAMNDYASYDPAWKDALVNALLYRITLLEDDITTTHTELESLTELYQQLSTDAAILTTEYENITATYMTENEALKVRLSSATTNTYIYQLVIVVLLVASVYIVVRFMRRDQKPTFKV